MQSTLSPWAGSVATTLQSRLAVMVLLPERLRAVAPSAPNRTLKFEIGLSQQAYVVMQRIFDYRVKVKRLCRITTSNTARAHRKTGQLPVFA